MKLIISILVLIVSFSVDAVQIYKKGRVNNISPIGFYFNGSYDVIQNPYYFSQRDYKDKHKRLFKRLGSPHHSIKKDGGYKKFFRDEFTTTRVLPNLGLHLLGSAYDTRFYTQYFKENNYSAPKVWAIFLKYLTHFGNEAFEITNDNITSHDNIADIYFFDIAAIFLSENDYMMRFFYEDLQMRHWHLQPMYDPTNKSVTNAGLNYIFRPDLLTEKIRPFFLLGMQMLGGLSYKYTTTKSLTLAVGMAITDPLAQKGRFATTFFVDDEDELLYALYLNSTEDYRVRLNVFPKAWKLKHGKLGLLLGQNRARNVVGGVNYNLPIGLAHLF